jgi:hypothetical protein
LLTPQEFEEYQMRTHPMMWRLRSAMTLLDASEQEFRGIFLAQKSFEDRMRAMRPSDAVALRGSSELASPQEVELQQQIKNALGEQRYADYLRAMNNEYQQLVRIAQRDNISNEAALRAFALREGVAQESNRIYNEPALTVDQKRTALQTLAQQTRAQILSTLGPTAGPAYVQAAARWLTAVERGSAVTFGQENRMSSKKVGDLPKP